MRNKLCETPAKTAVTLASTTLNQVSRLSVAPSPSWPLSFLPVVQSDPSVFTSTIPYEPSFLGVTFTLQALLSEPGRMRLTDALDLLVGDQ